MSVPRLALLMLLVAAVPAVALAGSPLHPEIVLRDVDGTPVLESGRPLAVATTCGACHDVEAIAAHGAHARLGPSGRATRGAVPDPAGAAPTTASAMECLLCHAADPDVEARDAALRGGHEAWVATATLARTGLVEPGTDGAWRWRPERFRADATAPRAVLGLGDPTSAHCGVCHLEGTAEEAPFGLGGRWRPVDPNGAGLVFSGQAISSSALNLRAKQDLVRPWDVHAARLVGCADCHHAPNNPAQGGRGDAAGHLAYDARRLDLGDYLERPDHDFMRGESARPGATPGNRAMRRCEDCHDAVAAHEDWLPQVRRHMDVLLCETCHVPATALPAPAHVDWTVLDAKRRPGRSWRGTGGDLEDPATLLGGYEPVILPRVQRDGRVRHGPYNLHTTWRWVRGPEGTPVDRATLEAAWFVGAGEHHADLRAVLDADGDGRLAGDELRLDTDAKVIAVRARLAAVGAPDARIEGTIEPVGLHHGTVSGSHATATCTSCHAVDSRLARAFDLSPYVPAGAQAALVAGTNVRLEGSVARDADGVLRFRPDPNAGRRWVSGHARSAWIDTLGWLLVLGVALGAGVHGGLRARAARRAARGELA